MSKPIVEPTFPRTIDRNSWNIDQLLRRPASASTTIDPVQLYIPKLCWWQGQAILPLTTASLDPTDSPGLRDGVWSYIPIFSTETNPSASGYRDPYGAFFEDIDGDDAVRSVLVNLPGVYHLHYRTVINGGILNPDNDFNYVTGFGTVDESGEVSLIQIWGVDSPTESDAGEATPAELIPAQTDDGSLLGFIQATSQERIEMIASPGGHLPDHNYPLGTTTGGYCIAYRHDGVDSINVQALLQLVRLGDAHYTISDNDPFNDPVYGLHIPATLSELDVSISIDGAPFTPIGHFIEFAFGTLAQLSLNTGSFAGTGSVIRFDNVALGYGNTPPATDIFSDDFSGASIVPPWSFITTLGGTVVLDGGTLKITRPPSEFASAGVNVVNLGIESAPFNLQFDYQFEDSDGEITVTISDSDGGHAIIFVVDASTGNWTLSGTTGSGDGTVTWDVTGSGLNDTSVHTITIQADPA